MLQTPATVIQLARLGDLVQTLPLIRSLARVGSVRLVCDSGVKDWASLLPGVEEILPLDSRRWRSRCVGPLDGIGGLLDELRKELATLTGPELGAVFPLNDLPIVDVLTVGLCSGQSDRWLTARLLLVRSYIRLIGTLHLINRIHLSDLWVALTPNTFNVKIPSFPIPDTGTQFARSVLESFKRRNIKRLWAVILGSGAKCRRLEPEDFAAWWSAFPAVDRPGLILLGGAGEEELAARFLARTPDPTPGVLNLVGICSPAELLGLFREMDLVLGVDTGPLHWAAAVGAKILGFYFGEAGFHDTGPYGAGHLVIWPDCSEYPCHPARAESCHWCCRQTCQNVTAMTGLLINLIRGESLKNPLPQGFRLSLSEVNAAGTVYRDIQAQPEASEIIWFAALARRVLGLGDQDRELFGGELLPAQFRQLQFLCAAWIAEVEQLSVGATVPVAIRKEAQTEASQQIRNAMEALTKISNVEDEDSAAKRCLFSLEPESVGA